ncbi:hypothetical protein CLOP_g21893 [Closterium sp. NIES-67]|nr:hypothetical protein CLOP_g21893 [Closterium sp. NIES-67]
MLTYFYSSTDDLNVATFLDPALKRVWFERPMVEGSTRVVEELDAGEVEQLISSVQDEIQQYLSLPLAELHDCPLQFWKVHQELPALQRMARDYLAIPATSAPCERLFSQGRNLIHWQRYRLGAERIRACMMLKSWIASHPGQRLDGAVAAEDVETADEAWELGLEIGPGL